MNQFNPQSFFSKSIFSLEALQKRKISLELKIGELNISNSLEEL